MNGPGQVDGEKPSDSQHQSDRVAAGRGWAWTQMLRGSPENPGKGRKPSKGAFQPEPSTHLPGSTLLSQRVNPKLGSREARRSRVWRAGGVSEVTARKGSTWRWGPGGGGGMGDRLVGMHGFCWGPGGWGLFRSSPRWTVRGEVTGQSGAGKTLQLEGGYSRLQLRHVMGRRLSWGEGHYGGLRGAEKSPGLDSE